MRFFVVVSLRASSRELDQEWMAHKGHYVYGRMRSMLTMLLQQLWLTVWKEFLDTIRVVVRRSHLIIILLFVRCFLGWWQRPRSLLGDRGTTLNILLYIYSYILLRLRIVHIQHDEYDFHHHPNFFTSTCNNGSVVVWYTIGVWCMVPVLVPYTPYHTPRADFAFYHVGWKCHCLFCYSKICTEIAFDSNIITFP